MKKKTKISLLAASTLGLTSLTAGIIAASQLSLVPTKFETNKPLTVQYTSVKFEKKSEGQDDVEFIGSTNVKAKVGRQFSTVSQPIATLDGYIFSYWETWDEDGYHRMNNNDIIPADGLTLYPHFDVDIELQTCVGLQAIRDSDVSMITHGDLTKAPTVYYSKDGISWPKYTNGDTIHLKSGEVLYFKGDNQDGFNTSDVDYTSFSISGAVSLNGNVMTLLDNGKVPEDPSEEPIPNDYCFYKLFEECSGIVSISTNFLPSTHLKNYSYAYMFYNCRRLTDFPSSLLPDTTLDDPDETNYNGAYCYRGMFMNCSGLKTIPKGLLPAGKTESNPNGTLSSCCYYSMFEGCSGLESLPYQFLPATELTTACYCAMFEGCKKLGLGEIAVDLLPATKLAPYCYSNMFSVCEVLEDISNLNLPADEMAANCYNQMFYGCINLVKAPTLASTSLAEGCYAGMFYNCHKLETAPALPATTLATRCYEFMFCNCYALTTTLSLSATELPDYCYYQMFKNCTGLTGTLPVLPATQWGNSCYEEMFENCTGLTVTPAFPQTGSITLGMKCCKSMFSGCTSLQTASTLIAATPAQECYKYMFSGCTSLTSAGLRLTSITTECCSMMFAGCTSLHTYTSGQSRNLIWAVPNSGYSQLNISNMFQETADHPSAYTPSANTSYYFA